MPDRVRAASGRAESLLRHLNDKWTIEIIDALAAHGYRFYELREGLGIPENTLSRVLHKLERDGFVVRLESPTLQRHVQYKLTRLGRSFHDVAASFERWSSAHRCEIEASRAAFDPSSGGRAAPPEDDSTEVSPVFPAVTHAGFAVENVSTAARAWAELLGIDAPKVITVAAHVPERGWAAVRMTWIGLRNFRVNLLEPTDQLSPYKRFIDAGGPGFYHIGFNVTGDITNHVRALQAKGGQCILGGPDFPYADLDFGPKLGTIIEVLHAPVTSEPGCHPSVIATPSVSSLAIPVDDIHEAARQYLSLFGFRMSAARSVSFSHGSRGGTRRAAVLTGTIRQQGLVVNLVGASVDGRTRRLRSGLHLGFRVRKPLRDVVSKLQRHGGRLLAGDVDSDYVQVEMLETLGVIFEFTRKERRSRTGLNGPEQA